MDLELKKNMLALEEKSAGRAMRASEFRMPGPGHYNVDYKTVDPKFDKVGFILQANTERKTMTDEITDKAKREMLTTHKAESECCEKVVSYLFKQVNDTND